MKCALIQPWFRHFLCKNLCHRLHGLQMPIIKIWQLYKFAFLYFCKSSLTLSDFFKKVQKGLKKNLHSLMTAYFSNSFWRICKFFDRDWIVCSSNQILIGKSCTSWRKALDLSIFKFICILTYVDIPNMGNSSAHFLLEL